MVQKNLELQTLFKDAKYYLKGMPMPRPAEVHAVMVGQLSIF